MLRAIARHADRADFHVTLGRALNNLRDLDGAAEAFANAVRHDPADAQAHNYLGHVARQRGDYEEAHRCFRKAVGLKDSYGSAWRNLGMTLVVLGRHAEAVSVLQRAASIEPDHAEAHFHLAEALNAVGQTEAAIAALETGLTRDPDNPDALSNLGAAYQREGKIETAQSSFQRALEIDPRHGPALAGMAGTLDVLGQTRRGMELLEPALASTTPDPVIMIAHAQLSRRLGVDLDRVAAGLGKLDIAALPSHLRPTAHFTLGDIHDERGDYDTAFRHYRRANDSRQTGHDPLSYGRLVDRIIADYSPERMERLPRSAETSELPVFIVGMPRSGTTLVEQIIASLPQAWGAGELGAVAKLGRGLLGASGHLASLTVDDLTTVATGHIQCLQALAPNALRISDKMWQNFENLGFIELLWPNARVIHCTRDPLDTGVSCYFQSFGFGGIPFSFDLRHIGTFYQDYRRLMSHWQETSSLRTLAVSYEELVANQERVSRDIVEFLGLEWDPACLRFNETDRIVNTASYAQVKRPLYNTSVNRSRHYAHHLGPLIDALKNTAP